MSASDPPDRLPLTGADCFLRAFDAETRRRNRASHLAQLVLRLGPGFDAEAFGRTLREVARDHPILRAPIRRRFGLGAPAYHLAAARDGRWPAFAVHPAPAAGAPPPGRAAGSEPGGALPLDALPPLFFERLNERRRARHGELLRVDAVARGGPRPGTDLAFTWLHMLFDGGGSERFVALLEGRRNGTGPAVPVDDAAGAPAGRLLPDSARERGAMAMRWQRGMQALGDHAVRSLAGPARPVRQDLVYDVRGHGAEETAGIVERAARRAGFLTPMLFYVAVAIRAHDAVLRARGTRPASWVVPLPVDLRPKGREGAVFRTRVSLVWLAVRAEVVDDLEALVDALKAVRREAVRERQVECGVAAMDYARLAPARLYARMARRPLGGELCSFFFAWTGDFCAGLDRFFGAPVLDGFHAPSVPPSPGSGLVFSLRERRLNVTHVRQRGLLSAPERAAFLGSLTRDLGGGP